MDFVQQHGDNAVLLSHPSSYHIARLKEPEDFIRTPMHREAPQFKKFVPTLGALSSIPTQNIVMEMYRTGETNVFYQASLYFCATYQFIEDKNSQTHLS